MQSIRAAAVAAVVSLGLAACGDAASEPTALAPDEASAASVAQNATAQAMSDLMDEVNAGLAAEGAPYRLYMVEYVTGVESQEAGATVVAKNVGNKQLSADFVPFDPRRAAWSGPVDGATDDITWAVDQTADGAPLCCGVSVAAATAAIEAAMATWNDATCSTLPLTRVDDGGIDLGAITDGVVVADIQHAGFRERNYAGGVLGVTHTFIWTVAGVPTDIDDDGRADVAFREIYYDSYYPVAGFAWWWDIGAHIDVQSIAVHEAGHGLSQGHFGNIFERNDGSLSASPRAIMNALYSDPFIDPAGADIGGHCSNWAQWPNG